MLILDRGDVERVLTMEVALEAADAALRALSSGRAVMPQRLTTAVEPFDGLHLAMPAFVRGELESGDALAVKVVTVYPHNPSRHDRPMIQGALLLHEARTGALVALMDAEMLTAMRTGAVAGLATRLLSRPDAASMLIFGAGALAPAQVAAVCAVRPIKRVTVVSRSGTRDDALCARLALEHGVEARSIVSEPSAIRQAVEEADIITTATTSAAPLFAGEWLRPGTHINAMGAFRPSQREVDGTVMNRARLFVDGLEASRREAGDIRMAIDEGAIGPESIAGELGDLLLGRVAGRTDVDQITLFKSVGLAVLDAVTAARVHAAARAAGVGLQVELQGAG